MKRVFIVACSLVAAGLSPMVGATPAGAEPAVVTSASLQGWAVDAGHCEVSPSTATVAFRRAAAPPPLGDGAVALGVGEDPMARPSLVAPGIEGRRMSALLDLGYSTYVLTDVAEGQVPYLELEVDADVDGDGLGDRLRYRPEPQDLAAETWQEWNPIEALWSYSEDLEPVPLRTYAEMSRDPAMLGLRVAAGCADEWAGHESEVDAIRLVTEDLDAVFDFEADVADEVSVSIDDESISERSSGTVDVRLSAPVDVEVTVDITAVDGSAGPDDYVFEPVTVTFPAGETVQGVEVSASADAVDEPDESFVLEVSNTVGAVVGDGSGTITILDDDAPPVLSITGTSQVEGAGGGGLVTAIVELDGPSGFEVTASYGTAPGSAISGLDFAQATGTVTIPPGSLSTTLSVPVYGDHEKEANEEFTVSLSSAVNAMMPVDPVAVMSIVDDDGTRPAYFSVDDVVADESGAARFRVVRTGDTSEAARVNVATAAAVAPLVPATAGSDFTSLATTTLQFPAGVTAVQVDVPISTDSVDEQNEQFLLKLSTPYRAVLADSQAIATIVDDEGSIIAPASSFVSVADATLLDEGNSGTRNLTFTVLRTGSLSASQTVAYSTSNNTAKQTDYSARNGTLTFAPGDSEVLVNVPIVGDVFPEFVETFFLKLASPSAGLAIADAQALGSITDDDAGPPATIHVDDTTVVEGDSGTSTATFTIRREGSTSEPSTLKYVTGTATSPWTPTASSATDYTPVGSTTLSFAVGETQKTVTVIVQGDTSDEPNEHFFLTLSSFYRAIGVDVQAVATIVDDDGPLTPNSRTFLRVNDAKPSAEAESPQFTITRSGDLSESSTVTYATARASADPNVDFTKISPTSVSFAPGDSTKQVTIQGIADSIPETNEVFRLNLTSATNATISDGQGNGTLIDDDTSIVASAVAKVVHESDTDVATEITVRLSSVASTPITVAYTTQPGSATTPDDFRVSSGTLTFNPGVTAMTFPATVVGDQIDESNETFSVMTTPVAGAVAGPPATVTISDDDSTDVSVADATAVEGSGSITAIVSLSGVSASTITVDFATSSTLDVDAAKPGDYTGKSGTLTFAPGQISKSVVIGVIQDELDEVDEFFGLTLANPSGAALGDSEGIMTIVDDDEPPAVSISDASALEHEGSIGIDVTLSAPSGRHLYFNLYPSNASATSGDDFTGGFQFSAFIAAGDLSDTFQMGIVDGYSCEGDEVFTVEVLPANEGTATVADGEAVMRIGDIDCGGLSIHDAWTNEEAGTANFRVTMSTPQSVRVSATYATTPGSATASNDFTSANAVVAFMPGETEKVISIPIANSPDTCEIEETFSIQLTNANNATLNRSLAKAIIVDTDCVGFMAYDVQVNEGQLATVKIGLPRVATGPESIEVSTVDDTAQGGSDYAATSQTVHFARGERFKTIAISTSGGVGCESSETFHVDLVNPGGLPISRSPGVITIRDTSPTCLTINDVQVQEGALAVFTVTAFPTPTQQVSVKFSTAPATAVPSGFPNADYVGTTGTVTFEPGQATRTVAVSTHDTGSSGGCEGPETFMLQLSTPTAAQVIDSTGVGTIVDFPGDCASTGVSVADKLTNESAQNVVVTVSLSSPATQVTTVNLQTMEGTATPGEDYTTTVGTVTFNAGESSKTFSVPIADGTSCEANETFSVRVTGSAVPVMDGWGVVTIDDVDC